MLKQCDKCGATSYQANPHLVPNGSVHEYCTGYWREVKEESVKFAPTREQWENVIAADAAQRIAGLQVTPLPWCEACERGGHDEAHCELQKLLDENARLKIDLANTKPLPTHQVLTAENQRLRMELGDMTGEYQAMHDRFFDANRELDFCKREIRRLDPRLAKARWGL